MEDGWSDYIFSPPPAVLCQFRRESTGETFLANPLEFSRIFNVAGLQWRLTGIGKQQIEADPRLSWDAQQRGLAALQAYSQQMQASGFAAGLMGTLGPPASMLIALGLSGS